MPPTATAGKSHVTITSATQTPSGTLGDEDAAEKGVAARLIAEGAFPFAHIARELRSGRRAAKVAPSTLWRWCQKGKRAPGGQIVYLEAFNGPGSWFTSLAAVARFFDALSVRPAAAAQPAMPRTPGQRARSAQAAAKALDKIGI